MIPRILATLVLATICVPVIGAEPPPVTPAQRTFFENKVRPLLAEHCYKCHSAAEGKTKGGLALDTRDGLLKGGDSGPAITPGNPDASRLITSVTYNDPDLKMPPKGEKLTEQQIAALTEWVRQGAPDPRIANTAKLSGITDRSRSHWAFQPVQPQTVPQPKDSSWVRTPIDAFILAKLEETGLRPAAPATKEALIRRATYDLIGLPPTLEEVKAFVEDTSPKAFEKVIDRLLASPHYGERWGRYWLDTVRYADTAGPDARQNEYRYVNAWTYRDYVIEAINDDKPYDQFLREQIAADLLPESKEDPSRLAALGFLTVGRRFPIVHDTIAERIDTVTKATQGLTVACAKCHDHKFDPIPTADYYSLHGIFASTTEPARKPIIREAADPAQRESFNRQLADLEQRNRDEYYRLLEKKGGEFRSKAATYLLFTVNNRKSQRANQLERIRLINEAKLDLEIYNGIRTVQRTDPIMGPLARYAELPDETFAEKAAAVTEELLSPKSKTKANAIVLAALREAFAEHAPKTIKEVTMVYGKVFGGITEQAARYLKACEQSKDGNVEGFDADLAQLIQCPLKIEPANGLDTAGLLTAVQKLPLRNGNYGQFLFADINELELTHPGAPAKAMVLNDTPDAKDSPIFVRGEPGNRGQIVPRRYVEVLSGPGPRTPFRNGSGRLELANAIASKENPLTARAFINRVWLHHFGEGFVSTPEDLGVMAEPPSHPELFDWLAGRLVQDGWSLKKMHRLIMLSNVYRQSGTPNEAVAQLGSKKDPENRLLWHANLRRLDFEALRDSMLMYGGKLDRTVGGHPVNLTDEPFSYRRSVYGYIDRGAVPDLMSQFDFSDPDMPNSRRASTIVPQQALFFMNSPFCADVSRKIIARPEFAAAKNDSARVTVLFQILLQRNPKLEEMRLALEFLAECPTTRQPTAKTMTPTRPKPAATPAKKGPASFTRAVQNEGTIVERRLLTPWEQLAQALLFTNDVVYVD